MTKDEYDSLKRGDQVLYKGNEMEYAGKIEFKSVIFDSFDEGSGSYPFFYPSELLTDDFHLVV